MKNATITDTRKTVLSVCQGLSGDSSRLLHILQPPFLQESPSMRDKVAGVEFTLLSGGVAITCTSSNSVSPPCCVSAVFVDSNLDGGSILLIDDNSILSGSLGSSTIRNQLSLLVDSVEFSRVLDSRVGRSIGYLFNLSRTRDGKNVRKKQRAPPPLVVHRSSLQRTRDIQNEG